MLTIRRGYLRIQIYFVILIVRDLDLQKSML